MSKEWPDANAIRFFIIRWTQGLSDYSPGWGGTLIFSYIRSLGSFFGVQKFELQYFGGFQKK